MNKTAKSMKFFINQHQQMLTEDQEKALFLGWKETKSNKIREKIVKAYSPIVRKCAKRLSGYEIEQEDLISVGTLALIEAIDRYDLDKGFRFATFCYSWVSGLMLAHITRNYFSVNLASSQDMKRIFFNLRRLINQQMKLTGNLEITPEFFQMVAEKLNVSEEDVELLYHMFQKPQESLSEPMSRGSEDEDYTRESSIASTDIGPEITVINDQMSAFSKQLITDAMERVLSAREKKIFVAQMLREDGEIVALQELADELGLSKERVRQLRDSAFNKVRVAVLTKVSPRDRFLMFKEEL